MKLLRETEPNWTIRRLTESAGISGTVSIRTVNRFLNKNSYKYLQARRKGLLSNEDKQAQVDFAKMVLSNYDDSLSTERIALYLDGLSFAFKMNPKSKYAIWRGNMQDLKRNFTFECEIQLKCHQLKATIVRMEKANLKFNPITTRGGGA